MMEFISPKDVQYKANLHAHTTLSDGHLTPEAVVKAYREHGYQILALTDHEAPYDHSRFTTPDFLMVTGYEAYIRSSPQCQMDWFGPEIHLNLLAKEPGNRTFIAYDPAFCKYMTPEEAEKLPKAGFLGPRQYDRGYIQRYIDAAVDSGYLVSYNHPCWSMEAQEDMLALNGCFSIEVLNAGAMTINGYEYNMAAYDAMLRRGKFPYCHGADDNHNVEPLGSFHSDSFGAWTMILAEELTYPAVIRALEQGRFYASSGPTINALRFDGKKVHMEFSEAVWVIMHMSPKLNRHVYHDDGSAFCQADFEIPDFAPYVYFTVRAKDGTAAHTHAFTRKQIGI